MEHIAQRRTSNVIRNCIRQIHAGVAEQVRPQPEIDIVKIGKKILIELAAEFETLTAVQHSSATPSEDCHRPIELAIVPIEVAQTISGAGHQHCVSGAVEVSTLG